MNKSGGLFVMYDNLLNIVLGEAASVKYRLESWNPAKIPYHNSEMISGQQRFSVRMKDEISARRDIHK